MQNSGIHFMYDTDKENDDRRANKFSKYFGQAPVEDAHTIVSVGGDGQLLRALHIGAGKKVCGLTAPGSNSCGFWTNRGIGSADDLRRLLQKSDWHYPVSPLQADIEFSGGGRVVRYGFNDVRITSPIKELSPELREKFNLSAIDLSGQSMLVNLKTTFSETAKFGPVRIMGSGLIFATPLGSTAMSHNFSGPVIDLRQNIIILNGMGISEPRKGFSPIVARDKTHFEITVPVMDKRPAQVSLDSFGIIADENNNPIQKINVSLAHDRKAQLVLKEDPALRAMALALG